MENPKVGIEINDVSNDLNMRINTIKVGCSGEEHELASPQPLNFNWKTPNKDEGNRTINSPLFSSLLGDVKGKVKVSSNGQPGLSKENCLKVEFGESISDTPDNARKLFFKPLNKHSTREEVLHILERFGRVDYLRVPYSNKKRKNLGYGFVVFQSQRVADFLCDHKIKTKIDDKIVGFSKFDIQKFKNKRKDSEESSSEGVILMKDLSSLNYLNPEPNKNFALDCKSHFLKPTNKRFFSIYIPKELAKHKYKFNLERLHGKEIRDTKSRISLLKLRSTQEVL